MRIGILSTRLSGSDGVSLEARKWSAILRQMGHELYYCAGELDADLKGSLIPRMHFLDAEIQEIQRDIFCLECKSKEVSQRIADIRQQLYADIKDFISVYHVELLIVENALSIPMNVPLAMALTDLIEDLRLPTIAHHHDFMWERERFAVSWMDDELEQLFPPALPNIQHVVINSLAREQLQQRRGLHAEIIPNVFDFENFHYGLDSDHIGFRQTLGISDEDWMMLQPTRIIPRKGIEFAIELVRRMRLPANRHSMRERDVKLVLSHPSGDEGDAYFAALKQQAQESDVPLIYAADKIAIGGRGPKISGKFQLWDAYLNADFVTYPSLIEGFGNAFLESVFFRLPLLIKRYEVFVRDIEPLGFDLVKFDDEITSGTVNEVIQVMLDPIRRRRMTEWNFDLAKTNFSYQAVTSKLSKMIEQVPV